MHSNRRPVHKVWPVGYYGGVRLVLCTIVLAAIVTMYSVHTPQISSVLRPALNLHFPALAAVRLIAEPGRFYVSRAFTVAVNVIAKRRVTVALSAGPSDEQLPTAAGRWLPSADWPAQNIFQTCEKVVMGNHV